MRTLSSFELKHVWGGFEHMLQYTQFGAIAGGIAVFPVAFLAAGSSAPEFSLAIASQALEKYLFQGAWYGAIVGGLIGLKMDLQDLQKSILY